MTDGLGPDARALLEAARDGMSPDAAAVRRMRAKIGHATAAGTATAGTAVAVKLFVIGVVAAVVAAGVYVERRRATRAEPARIAAPASPVESPAAAAAPAAPPSAGQRTVEPPAVVAAPPRAQRAELAAPAIAAPAGQPLPAPPVARVAIGESPPAELPPRRSAPPHATSPAPRRATGAKPVVVTRPVPAPPRGPIDLAREVELVDLAMTALGRGDPTAALAIAQRHASETGGRGQLAEDAAAIEIEALCQLHAPSQGAKLAAFDARFPHSAQRSRLDRSCR